MLRITMKKYIFDFCVKNLRIKHIDSSLRVGSEKLSSKRKEKGLSSFLCKFPKNLTIVAK